MSQYDINRANDPLFMKILDGLFLYTLFPLFVVFSFWFWFDSLRNNPENLEEFHFLSDITWFGIWLGIIVAIVLIASGVTWFYREFLSKD